MFKIFKNLFFKNLVSHNLTIVALLFVFTYQSTISLHKVYADDLDKVSIQDSQVMAFSKSPRWRRLLYYKPSGVSEINSPIFFLAKNGNNDPYLELKESLYQMFDQATDSINDEHAICKFPARFYFLDKEFKRNEFHKIKYCPKFLDFVNRSSGQSISLVFSSYSLSSPSSAFGHTFLKINKADSKDYDLLNYGINYAATTTGANPVFYALQGLLGFYKGEYTAIPFYYKLREYSDFESRDLWEYELNFDYEEVQALTMHFWELGRAWSWYYFLGKNCSYWALKSLQAVSLDLDFEKELKRVLVIPVETIKALYDNKDLVKNISYRPSLQKQLKSNLVGLTRKDQNVVKDISEKLYNQEDLDGQSIEALNTNILDSALLYYDYRYAKSYIVDERLTLEKKQALLVARSKKSKDTSEEIKIEPPVSPEKIHPPQRISAGYRVGDSFQSLKASYKMGFHELLDSKDGMEAALAMNYLDIGVHAYKLQYSENWKFNFDYVDFIRIEALPASTFLDKKISWRLNVSIREDLLQRSVQRKVGHIKYDSGMAFALNEKQSALLYILLSNNLESSVHFKNNFRLSVAPLLGVNIHWTQNWATQLEVKHHWFWDTKDFGRQWISELQTQMYLPHLQTAFYLKALAFDGIMSGFSLDDAQIEAGVRKFY